MRRDDRLRPYIQWLQPRFRAFVQVNWDDARTLEGIHHELTFRTWKGAVNLREKVDARITELTGEYFPWPSVSVLPSTHKLNPDVFSIEKSPLKELGYTVGKNGKTQSERRVILRLAYEEPLPVVVVPNDPLYMQRWGAPRTGPRLRQIAENIASSTRAAKRKAQKPYVAIGHWEADLEHLRLTYYVGEYDFQWPAT